MLKNELFAFYMKIEIKVNLCLNSSFYNCLSFYNNMQQGISQSGKGCPKEIPVASKR